MGIYNYIANSIKEFYEQYKRSKEIEMSPEESSQVRSRMAWFTGQGLSEDINARFPCAVRVNHQGQRYDVKLDRNSVFEVTCTGIEKVMTN